MTEGRLDEVFLTGGTGFIGSHVLRTLVAQGFSVRALIRPSSEEHIMPDGCTTVTGDVRRPGEIARLMAGCRYLIHVAAVYSFAAAKRKELWHTNVNGTQGLLEAARIAGIERAVVTSSSAVVGPMSTGTLPTEENRCPEGIVSAGYHASKVAQERVALAAQLPVVLVLPTAPVGPNDWKPTPTGEMVLDFMRGRIFASPPGGMNLVPVEDVARAHALALRSGRPGERYLVGGENLTFADIWQRLAVLCGRPAPRRRLPGTLGLALGWADELRCRVFAVEEPLVPLEGVRMAREDMYVCDAKARAELGYESGSVTAALGRAVAWYRAHGYADRHRSRAMRSTG